LQVESVANRSLLAEGRAVAALPAPERSLPIRFHGRTDVGRTRGVNEDQFLTAVLTRTLWIQSSLAHQSQHHSAPQGHLFVVADGLGGNNGGGQASALAVDTIESFALNSLTGCTNVRGSEGEQLLGEFKRAIEQANARLCEESECRPALRGMATTLTLAYVLGRELFVAHVGDSRCYLLRKQVLCRLTDDHTLLAELVRQGAVRPEEAAGHHGRHVMTNVVGGSVDEVQVELHRLPLADGERLLLCSDGLTEMVPEGEIRDLLVEAADPGTACNRLIERANEQGGRDNVTVVVAFFGEEQTVPSTSGS